MSVPTRTVVVYRTQPLPPWVPASSRQEIAEAMESSIAVVVAEQDGEFCFWHLGTGAEVELAIWLTGGGS